MMNRFHLALIFQLLITTVWSQYSIPGDRRIDWTPGVPGGIPQISENKVNVLDFGADNSGLSDASSAFADAISALPEGGGIVFVPEGKYRLNSAMKISKDGVVIRGEGLDKTRILSYHSGNSIEVTHPTRGQWQSLTGGFDLHSNTVTVQDGSKFTVGEFAQIRQENDALVMYTRPDWNQSWAQHAVGQFLEVESIDGNEVTFKTALHFDFAEELNPQIRPQDLTKYVGFEDFYIQKRIGNGNTFHFDFTAYCWMQGVESYYTRNSHANVTWSLGIEIRDCFMHKSYSYGGGGSAYGVNCAFSATDCLIEDNVFDSLRHAMLVHVGANGNVFGYNYSINPLQGEGETNLNQGWIPPDISIHGHYPFMNLFEGNYVFEVGIADYWGPAGRGNTYFRNDVYGEGIIYYDYSHYQNVIGNQTTNIDYTDKTSKFMLEHGNVINGQIDWNDTIDTQELPVSLYLDEKPGFFEDTDWPTYGPLIDSEIKLPAQVWYEEVLLAEKEPVINSIKSERRINIYPNPATDKISIAYASAQTDENELLIYNLAGKLLDKISLSRSTDVVSWSIPDQSGDMLVIKLASQDEVNSTKVLLRR